MDYRDGTAGPYMGVRSIMAIEKGVAQLKALFPGKKDSEYWAMTAATPMLGQNDAEPEIFTLDDARKILELAQAKGMARLSFWSLDRDNGKCSGKRVADPTCSGIEQEEWAFSKIFVQHR
jgi:chitinase